MKNFFKNLLFFSLIVSSLVACNKAEDGVYTVDTTEEIVQQIGDSMVSIDEAGGSTNGTITFNPSGYEKSFARLSQDGSFNSKLTHFDFSDLLISKSYAAACSSVTFSCNASTGVSTRTLAGCSVAGAGTATGSVSLSFTGSGMSTCTMPSNGDRVVRAPRYQISGLRGATFTVEPTTTGQTFTRSGGAVTFASTGIRRTFNSAASKAVLDMTVLTTSPITVVGSLRNGRSISGGNLVIQDNLTANTCTLSPSSILWSSGCNCPTSGFFNGTCTDGTSLRVDFSSTCGTASYTVGAVVKSLALDRCQP